MTEQKWSGPTSMPHSKCSLHRNGEEWRADRLLLNKEVMMSAAVQRFLPLLDEVARDFCQMLQTRVEREGRGEEGKRSLVMDPSPDLFRFALEGRRSWFPVICILWFTCVFLCVVARMKYTWIPVLSMQRPQNSGTFSVQEKWVKGTFLGNIPPLHCDFLNFIQQWSTLKS